MEINIKDYLNDDEIKEIAKEEVRVRLRQTIQDNDFDRILTNTAYKQVFKMVDEHFDGGLVDILSEKTKQIIEDLSGYSVFRRKDMWGKEDSKAYTYLQEAVEEHKGVLFNKVETILKNVDVEDIQDRIIDLIYDVIERKLKGS